MCPESSCGFRFDTPFKVQLVFATFNPLSLLLILENLCEEELFKWVPLSYIKILSSPFIIFSVNIIDLPVICHYVLGQR